MRSDVFCTFWVLICGLFLLRLSWKHWQFYKNFELLKDVIVNHNLAWPRVSLIIPACNEETTIGSALETLLTMDYPSLEVIVVNDRSQDKTQDVIDQLIKKYPQLKCFEVKTLPDGWLGKVHALERGVSLSTGEWILFSDADVHYGVTSLKKAITYAIDKKIDFLTVCPTIYARGTLLKACMIQFTKILVWSLDLKKLVDPNYRQAIGIGAFNLMKRNKYDSSRGLSWLKLEVIDDTGLAMMLKEDGARVDAIGGKDEIELEWYPNFYSFVCGVEKNSFSVIQFSYMMLLLNIFFVWGIIFGIFVLPLTSINYFLFISLCLIFYIYTAQKVLKLILPFSLSAMMLSPFVQLLFPLIVLRAVMLFSWRGGVLWRGTFYSKESLVAHQRLKLLDQFINRKFPKMKRDKK